MSNQTESALQSESNSQQASGSLASEATENETATDGFSFTSMELRVLGALMEKQLATPDAYPLTVNSLIAACKQKSNREPVTNYQQGELVRTLRELESRSLIRYEMGARSERYEQRFTNVYSLSKKQQALITIMLLRGPQTSSELYTRTQRMYEYTDREDMQVSLERLTMGDEPLVVLIPKGVGQREDRYGHLLCGMPEMPQREADNHSSGRAKNQDLLAEIAALRADLDRLYQLTGHVKEESGE